jgi:hypothetical protein
MTTSHARVSTKNASRYVELLSTTWARSATLMVCDHAHVVITLPFGQCELGAKNEFLEVTLTADSVANATFLEDLVSDRLDRIAQESLRYVWVLLHDADRAAEGQNPRCRVIVQAAQRSKTPIDIVA